MKVIRQIGSIAFVLGLFTAIFAGIPWSVMVSKVPVIPWWLRIAVFCLLGGILVVMLTLALEQRGLRSAPAEKHPDAESDRTVLLLNSDIMPHTVFAIWLGKDLSAMIRLIIGGELTEYTEMMGIARITATERMKAKAIKMGADAIINVRYMTTSVVGSAAELFAYGTAVKLSE
jgi:uncharacterized protein YbjQ (UPF0145 family)